MENDFIRSHFNLLNVKMFVSGSQLTYSHIKNTKEATSVQPDTGVRVCLDSIYHRRCLCIFVVQSIQSDMKY